MGLFDFLTGLKPAPQPTARPVDAVRQPVAVPVVKSSHECFIEAEELAGCLYGFPYQPPSGVPLSVRKDKELMAIIADTYPTTRAPDGSTQQTTISAAERIRLQAEFKKRIYPLLEQCLAADPEHAPAFLLFPRVAEYNTRAKDRINLIAIFERFLPFVDAVVKGTRAYNYIKNEIDGMGGNCFEMVERHLADYHYDLAKLYNDTKQIDSAKAQYKRAGKLCPKIYGRGKDKIKLM
jgi:tetratricopeptide (TPR) repeat protein